MKYVLSPGAWIALVLFFASPWALAQQEIVSIGESRSGDEDGSKAEADPVDSGSREQTSSLEARLAAVEQELEDIRAQQETPEFSDPSWTQEDSDEEPAFEPFLRVHGYFDLTYSYNDIPTGSPLHAYVAPYPTFLMSSLNLFLDAKPTPNLTTTVELAFSFMPAGLYLKPAYYTLDGTRIAEPVREEPWGRDNLTTALYANGSVRIVRAHATYQARDWLGITAGKFVTPYGIWNVDHASTVVLSAHVPYMQVREMMPLEQLGLQAFGRFFVGPSTYLDYNITLSNGRAGLVTTDIGDLDNNKAVGLGLGLSYDSADVLIKGGGYLYYGKLSESEPRAYINNDGGFDSANVVKTSSYHELIAAFHLLGEFKGVRLQSEVILSRGDVITPAQASDLDLALLARDTTADRYYQPSWTGVGVYGLAAYTLPLEIIAPVRIIPYVLFEYNRTRDTQPYFNQQYIAGGLNIRPQADLALKLEYSRCFLNESIYKGDLSLYAAQLAVSF
jgi:hypothetical protein